MTSFPGLPAELVLDTSFGCLRPLGGGDAEALTEAADDREVWRNVRDRFPHPYCLEDAREFIAFAAAGPEWVRAIDVGGRAAGAIALRPGDDVHTGSAEIGYWLARGSWGRGVMTESVRAVCAHAIAHARLVRIHAAVFAWNPASMRVLEKAGFHREGVLRQSILKDGERIDSVLYARVAAP